MLLIPIIGPSNSGKTTITRFASRATGVPELISYTTRPMRQGETEGVDHHFVDESFYHSRFPADYCDPSHDKFQTIPFNTSKSSQPTTDYTIPSIVSKHLLAHTIYGGHPYWVPLSDPLLSDHTNPTRCILYIIDEDGLRSILANPTALSKFDAIIPIRIERDPSTIAPCSSTGSMNDARTERDKTRHPLPSLAYYRTVHNDTTIEFAQYDLSRVVMDIVRYVREGDHYHLLRWYAYHKDMMC